MVYHLENHRDFFVVMVIECSVAPGEMEFGGRREKPRGKSLEWMGVSRRRGAILIGFCE